MMNKFLIFVEYQFSFSNIQINQMNETFDYEINDERIYHGLIKRVGLQGNYQKNFMRIIFLISMLSSSTFFVVPFLFYQNGYTCGDYEGDCNQLVCSLPQSQRSQYLSPPEIKSLGNGFGDLHCQRMGDITEMQESFLVGTSVGLVVIVFLIQYLGRKVAIASSLIITIISILLIMTVESLPVKKIGLFIWGGGSEISFSILVSFITEKTSQSSRMGNYVWVQVWFVFGCFMNCVAFYIFRDWQLVLGFYFVAFYVVSVVLFIYYVESPPLDLISRYSTEYAYNAFMRIAEINSTTDHGITYEQIEACQQQYKQNQKKKHNYAFNFFDLLRYSSIRSDFFKLSLAFLVISFLLYGPAFLLDDLKMNIFALSMVNIASQFLTLPFLSELMRNHPRSKTQTILMVISTIFGFLVYGLAPTDCFSCNKQWKFAFTLIAFFAFRIVTNLSSELFSCSVQQTFPAQIRSIGIYSVIAVGRLATITIPYQVKIKEQTGISLMLQFSLVSLLAVVIMAIMKQTWRVLPGQIIQELAIQHSEWKRRQKQLSK